MARLTFAQLRALWLEAGGAPSLADTMAAIALAESSGNPDAINPEACRAAAHDCDPCTLSNTGDYSIGLWQINYYGGLFESRKDAYGCPGELWTPIKNARAAVDIADGGHGLSAWTTFTSGAYRQYLGVGASGPTAAKSTAGSPHTVSVPRGPSGPTGDPRTLPEAWHKMTDALGKTLPTRTKHSNTVSRNFKRAVR
jgi:hypothetical protein